VAMTARARHDPLVSVVLPTHTRCSYLAVALRSVLAQTVDDLEVIVVNDASTDDTSAYLDTVADPRVWRVDHRLAAGAAASRNSGLRVARGRWTAFLDDDDLWAPGKLAAQLDALRGNARARWSCVAAVRVDDRLRIVGWHRLREDGELMPRLLRSNVIPGSASSVLAETALLRRIGGFSEALEASEDWDCWIRLASEAPLAAVDRPLTAYRITTGTRSHLTAREGLAIDVVRVRHRRLAERWGVEPDLEAQLRYLARQDLRSGRRLTAARTMVRLARRRRRYLLWAAAFLVVPQGWELALTRLLEPIRAPGWRRSTAGWLSPYHTAVHGG
jgi:glycosyltransferase involved in cell wall biosynthesis